MLIGAIFTFSYHIADLQRRAAEFMQRAAAAKTAQAKAALEAQATQASAFIDMFNNGRKMARDGIRMTNEWIAGNREIKSNV